MPYSPYMLYETNDQQTGLPQELILVVGPVVNEDGRLAFNDTNLPRFVSAGKLVETPAGFTWTPVDGTPPWAFTVVTKERFEKDWRPHLYGGDIPAFDTTERLWQWYSVHFGHGFWQ